MLVLIAALVETSLVVGLLSLVFGSAVAAEVFEDSGLLCRV